MTGSQLTESLNQKNCQKKKREAAQHYLKKV